LLLKETENCCLYDFRDKSYEKLTNSSETYMCDRFC
jgi:hypothetical protein